MTTKCPRPGEICGEIAWVRRFVYMCFLRLKPHSGHIVGGFVGPRGSPRTGHLAQPPPGPPPHHASHSEPKDMAPKAPQEPVHRNPQGSAGTQRTIAGRHHRAPQGARKPRAPTPVARNLGRGKNRQGNGVPEGFPEVPPRVAPNYPPGVAGLTSAAEMGATPPVAPILPSL